MNPFINAFGLDINDLSIKIVQLDRRSAREGWPSHSLVTARSIRLPHGLVVDGVLEQPEQVRKYIQHLMSGTEKKHRPINSRWVVGSLPDAKGFIKLIHIDKNPDELIEEDVMYQAKRHIPFEDDAYYVDWQVMTQPGSGDSGSDVLIGAVPSTIADMYTYLIESLGLGVIALELEPLAIARAMITDAKDYAGEARALLDIGATRSCLIIYDHNHVQLSRTLRFSGELVTTAISQKLHVSYEEADKQKVEFGLQFQDNKEVWPILTTLVDELVKQIQETLNFYYSHVPDANRVTHITMCGGGARLKKLDDILSLKLNITSAPGNVWKNLHAHKPIPVSSDVGLSFTTAIGLALRAAENPFKTQL